MLKQRAGSSKAAKAHPLSPRPLPLSAFAGRWPLRAALLEPTRVAVYGDAVRHAKRILEGHQAQCSYS